ncbi:MAG: hypothetical protein IJP10_06195 [Clostridia bacterium]|nr:hypothetical protein [Clostridia bacterium]
MPDNDFEYNARDYIEDKILSSGSGPKAAEAKQRIMRYELGDIENATRLKHGYKYKPHESTTEGCLSYLLIIIMVAAIFTFVVSLCYSCGGCGGGANTAIWNTVLIVSTVVIIACNIILHYV